MSRRAKAVAARSELHAPPYRRATRLHKTDRSLRPQQKRDDCNSDTEPAGRSPRWLCGLNSWTLPSRRAPWRTTLHPRKERARRVPLHIGRISRLLAHLFAEMRADTRLLTMGRSTAIILAAAAIDQLTGRRTA